MVEVTGSRLASNLLTKSPFQTRKMVGVSTFLFNFFLRETNFQEIIINSINLLALPDCFPINLELYDKILSKKKVCYEISNNSSYCVLTLANIINHVIDFSYL